MKLQRDGSWGKSPADYAREAVERNAQQLTIYSRVEQYILLLQIRLFLCSNFTESNRVELPYFLEWSCSVTARIARGGNRCRGIGYEFRNAQSSP